MARPLSLSPYRELYSMSSMSKIVSLVSTAQRDMLLSLQKLVCSLQLATVEEPDTGLERHV
jgi:hypothetical protein